ncbi:MAG: DUF494 family protein [Candidatus Hydrogenedentes bacterium]|nr:DUF494 family protein [Candidatus Hydrogenedentota bacterium]
MKQTLDKLVIDILRHIEEHPEFQPSEKGIRSWLTRQGYKKREIDAAIRHLDTRMKTGPQVARRQAGFVRQLSRYETLKMSPEARDALVRLELYELITPYERELLLERLVQFEGELGLEDLDYLLSWILCTTRDVETQQTIYSVFEGTKSTLH